MILTDNPEHLMVTTENQNTKTESEGKWEGANREWDAGVESRKDDGGSLLSYMEWSQPSPEERTVWIHKIGQAKDAPGSHVASIILVPIRVISADKVVQCHP